MSIPLKLFIVPTLKEATISLQRQALLPMLKLVVNSQLQDCECQTIKTIGVHRRQCAIHEEVEKEDFIKGRRLELGLEGWVGFANARKNPRKNVCNQSSGEIWDSKYDLQHESQLLCLLLSIRISGDILINMEIKVPRD